MTFRLAFASSLFAAMIAACVDGSSESVGTATQVGAGGTSSSSGSGSGGGAGATGPGGSGTSTAAGGAPTGGGTSGSTGVGGSVGAAGSAGGSLGTGGSAGSKDAGSGGGSDSGTAPPSSDAGPSGIPMPTGACPDFVQGDVMFNPAGGARMVAMTLTDASRTITGGPLVFYWFATGSNPTEASRGLPLAAVTAAGGIVVAPYDVAGAGVFPWLSQLPQHDALFDEVVACAVQKTRISTARIHAVGFSAGALMTTHLSYARSKFLASVATYSGGAMGQFQEMNNKFAAMIMTGGTNDILVQDFFMSSQQWFQTLKTAGHFAMFCDHGGGHSLPTRLVPGVWQFFVDHPYGRVPSPYMGNIPAAIAPPCIE